MHPVAWLILVTAGSPNCLELHAPDGPLFETEYRLLYALILCLLNSDNFLWLPLPGALNIHFGPARLPAELVSWGQC